MTTEEAKRRIEEHMVVHHIGEYPHIKLREALSMAIAALRAQQEAEQNEPLTLAELREMDGEPVYLHGGGEYGEWVLVRVEETGIFLRHKNGICAPAQIAFECGIKIYRHKPEEGTV